MTQFFMFFSQCVSFLLLNELMSMLITTWLCGSWLWMAKLELITSFDAVLSSVLDKKNALLEGIKLKNLSPVGGHWVQREQFKVHLMFKMVMT